MRKRWKANTWIATDSASITKIPPIRISSTSVLVITASAGDRAAEPERAGVAHEHRGRERVEPEEADAGADQAGAQQREVGWTSPVVMNVIAVKARNTIAQQPAARPSSPSVRFTPLVAPASTRKISTG